MSKHERVETTVLLEPVSYHETGKGQYTLMRCPECYELVPAWISCEECGWSRVDTKEYGYTQPDNADYEQETLGEE